MPLLGRDLLAKLNFTSSRSHRTCVYKCGDACAKAVPNTSDNPYFRDILRREVGRRSVLRGARGPRRRQPARRLWR